MNRVPEKALYTLRIIAVFFVILALRVWYLSILKHDEYAELAKRPALRTVIELPERGTIRDRFNHPLAVNKIQYNAAVSYDPIRRIPRVKWIRKGNKRVKEYKRRDYITKLSQMLAEELELDATYIEDLLYSKASLFPHTPFVIKADLDEATYYRLTMIARDFPGLTMQLGSKRVYPYGKTGANIIGYMGAINEREYGAIKKEITLLEEFISDRQAGLPAPLPTGYKSAGEVKRRLSELRDKSYSITSRVGKSGIEGEFDVDLRGLSGKTRYEVDIQGNHLRKLPESYGATPGRRVLLTMSAEMQEHAEFLLKDSEAYREKHFSTAGKGYSTLTPPWLKGGAIVAMLPESGEVVALASFPSFDPNDFSRTGNYKSINKWLETPAYIAGVWDGKYPLERDLPAIDESKTLTWDLYLSYVLSLKSEVLSAIKKISNIQTAIYLQNSIETLYELSEETKIHHLIDALFPKQKGHKLTFYETDKEHQKRILQTLGEKTSLLDEIVRGIYPYLSHVSHNDDKILLLDLCRLAAPGHLFDDKLLTTTGKETLSVYRTFNQATVSVQEELKSVVKNIFHDTEFTTWRATYFKEYLKEKRQEEKEKKRCAKPYLDYLEAVEKELFNQFFDLNKWDFLTCFLVDDAPINMKDIRMPYFQAIIEYSLKKKSKDALLLQSHLNDMPKEFVIPYLRTMRSYNELNRPLWGRYYFPFKAGKFLTEKDLARHFYPGSGFSYARSYAYQENAAFGSAFKIITGYEALRQHYLKHQETNHLWDINPMTIIDQSPSYSTKMTHKTVLGYTQSGMPILRHYKGGRLPRGHLNIGKVDFPTALERSSNLYFAMLASDVIERPHNLVEAARAFGFGRKTEIDLSYEARGTIPKDMFNNQTGLYAFAIGQHSLSITPLQAAVSLAALANYGEILKPQIVKTIVNIEPTENKNFLFSKKDFAYQELLKRVGIHFPLFTEAEDKTRLPFVYQSAKEVIDTLFLPDAVRSYLFKGLYEVVNGKRGTARLATIKTLWDNPIMRRHYKQIQPYLIGKTSTAECSFRPTLERHVNPIICKHLWFAGISFEEPENFDTPELVVIVYLRFADHGKEAAPLAAEMVKKWREINNRHKLSQ